MTRLTFHLFELFGTVDLVLLPDLQHVKLDKMFDVNGSVRVVQPGLDLSDQDRQSLLPLGPVSDQGPELLKPVEAIRLWVKVMTKDHPFTILDLPDLLYILDQLGLVLGTFSHILDLLTDDPTGIDRVQKGPKVGITHTLAAVMTKVNFCTTQLIRSTGTSLHELLIFGHILQQVSQQLAHLFLILHHSGQKPSQESSLLIFRASHQLLMEAVQHACGFLFQHVLDVIPDVKDLGVCEEQHHLSVGISERD